jgi:hypothetical protein
MNGSRGQVMRLKIIVDCYPERYEKMNRDDVVNTLDMMKGSVG